MMPSYYFVKMKIYKSGSSLEQYNKRWVQLIFIELKLCIFYIYIIVAYVLQAHKIQALINYKEICYKRNSNQCEVSFFSLTVFFETEKNTL